MSCRAKLIGSITNESLDSLRSLGMTRWSRPAPPPARARRLARGHGDVRILARDCGEIGIVGKSIVNAAREPLRFEAIGVGDGEAELRQRALALIEFVGIAQRVLELFARVIEIVVRERDLTQSKARFGVMRINANHFDELLPRLLHITRREKLRGARVEIIDVRLGGRRRCWSRRLWSRLLGYGRLRACGLRNRSWWRRRSNFVRLRLLLFDHRRGRSDADFRSLLRRGNRRNGCRGRCGDAVCQRR